MGIEIVFVLEQVANGLLLGLYYLLIALGLSIIFSLGGVVNLAHGAFYALGAYLMVWITGLAGYGAGFAVSPVAVALLGMLVERLFLRRFYQADPVLGLLFTFGLAMVIEQALRMVFGASPVQFAIPPYATGIVAAGDFMYPIYRLAMLSVALAALAAFNLASLLWLRRDPVVGDGALLAALTRSTGHGMRDIVATIQREQDEAIRSPASGVTIVSGGPGTGKTAVALHRAAYLLYSDRNRFAGGGVLVVGPSAVFVDYIASVLPALGENAATLHSLGSLFEGVTATRTDPAPVAAIKGSLRMCQVLQRAVRDQVPDAPRELRLLYRGELLRLTARELEQIRLRALPPGARRNEVRRAGFDGIFEALWAQARHLQIARLPEQATFEDELAERPEFRDFLRAWWPRLHPIHVLRWLAQPERLRRYARGILSEAEIRLLAEAYQSLPVDGPTVADVALLDELDELLGRPPRPPRAHRDPYLVAGGVREVTTYADRQRAAARAARDAERPADYRDYAHVVVDEAQDVSPMQWRMLGRRGRLASWTIVGDPAQSAWTGDPAELARARDEALGRLPRHEYTLTTNYRNSAEIFAAAARVIREVSPDLPLPVAVRQTGVEPVALTVPAAELPDAVREATAKVLAEVEGTVGVITPVPRRAEVARWLSDEADPRLAVVDCLQAKGMEYDGVVLVGPGEIRADSPAGVRTLYVALSRATQRLVTIEPAV